MANHYRRSCVTAVAGSSPHCGCTQQSAVCVRKLLATKGIAHLTGVVDPRGSVLMPEDGLSGKKMFFGNHAVETELLSLLWLYRGACVIVTRNGSTEEIRKFLTAHGAPEDLPIHVAKKPKSKAECAVDGLMEDECAVYVDASVTELADPLVAGDRRVYRVLFVRERL